jgi:hypothetical protein
MCADSATLAGSAGNHLPHERDHLLWAGRVRLLWEVDRYLVEVEKITPRRSNSPGSEIAPFIRPNLTGLRRTIGEKKGPVRARWAGVDTWEKNTRFTVFLRSLRRLPYAR